MDCGGCYNGLCKGNCHRPPVKRRRPDRPIVLIPLTKEQLDEYGLTELEDEPSNK